MPKAKDFEKLASLPSLLPSSFPPCSVLLWKLAKTWDRFCLDSFDPFISSLVKNFYQKPKSLSRWRHFSSIQPFSPSILFPPCTVFSNRSEWLIPRHNYTRLFVKSNAILCSTKITSPPFFFVPYPVLMYDHEDWKLASARDQFHLRSFHYWLLVKLVASFS